MNRRNLLESLNRIDQLAATLKASNPDLSDRDAQMQAFEKLRAEERDQKMTAVRRKAEALVARADIGNKMSVRLDRKTTVEGILQAVRVAQVRQNGAAIEAVFEVDLLCGISSFPRTIRVCKIPTR